MLKMSDGGRVAEAAAKLGAALDEGEWFRGLVGDSCSQIVATLGRKQSEYAVASTFHNFERAGAMLGCSPERALAGMMAKHLVSIHDLVDAADAGQPVSTLAVEEKIGDALCYLVLLKGLLLRGSR